MPYFTFTRTTGPWPTVWTVRLESLAGWTVKKQPIWGERDSYGQQRQIGEGDRTVVSFASPLSGELVTLTPDQSDAFLKAVASIDVCELDPPGP